MAKNNVFATLLDRVLKKEVAMTYKRFEDLPVWQAAMDLGGLVYELTEDKAFIEKGDLADQMRRASTSISNNIAEGFERGTTPELVAFLYIARGSAGELRSQLHFCQRRERFERLDAIISKLIVLAESCSRQLGAWLDSIKNSNIKGQKFLNDAVREEFSRQRRGEAFLTKLKSMTPHLRNGNGAD